MSQGGHAPPQQAPICAYLRLSRVNLRNYIIEGTEKLRKEGRRPSNSRNFSGAARTKNL